MTTSPSHLWAGWASQVGRGNGKLKLSIATLGQGGRAARSGLLPSPPVAWLGSGPPGWVSLGHVCGASSPSPPARMTPVIQIAEADVGFPLHLVISVSTPKLQLTWLRLLRSPSCPFVPSCLLPHAIFIPTHTSSSTRTFHSVLFHEARVRTT